MTVTVLIAGITVVMGSLVAIVLVTVLFRKALADVVLTAERASQRADTTRDKLLDRMMARTFEEYKVYDAANEVTGSFEVPSARAERPWAVTGSDMEETSADR